MGTEQQTNVGNYLISAMAGFLLAVMGAFGLVVNVAFAQMVDPRLSGLAYWRLVLTNVLRDWAWIPTLFETTLLVGGGILFAWSLRTYRARGHRTRG